MMDGCPPPRSMDGASAAPNGDAMRPDGDAPTPTMDIQPRAPDPEPSRRPQRGGIVRVVSRWNPRATPKLTASLTLYVFGLFVAFVASPPVTVTDEMQSRYFAKMDAADALDLEPRTRAEQALARASANVRRANGFMCWADARCRAKVRDLREVERVRLAEANAFRAARDAAVREAKSELGLWSSLGVDEAKALFRQSYERGKLYATRTSYYDTFWLILAGRSDDSMLELLLRWGFHVLSNFTAGMIGAVWNYAWALPALIRSFAASWWSGVAFFLVAVVSAASVAASLLLLLFGTAGGVTYGVVAAAPHFARLEAARDQRERQRLLERNRPRPGAARPHVD